jgi:hypothetical protein
MREVLGAQFEKIFNETQYSRQENEIRVFQDLPGGRVLMIIE